MELIKMGGAIGFVDPSPTSNGGYDQQTSTKEYIRRDGSLKDHEELYRPQKTSVSDDEMGRGVHEHSFGKMNAA